eukprot:TRINITY_DN108607_c6_g1_i1.p1 TRINITY_DN108607_c6_g1~~TRINITY_DN108607_c6_g1_i1.p1  ORF type:complete len:378 (+),score=59.95 TRINITY_DN108607_c6_g1_i1:72-1205(+)
MVDLLRDLTGRITLSDEYDESGSDPETGGRGSRGSGSDGGSRPDEVTTLAATGCGCITLLVFIIMMATSFKGLHATQYGILRNSLTGVVNFDTTYHGGRNLIGFWNDYIHFPATVRSLEWLEGRPMDASASTDLSPMKVRTADGLMVNLGIVAQYHVVEAKIADIYRDYKADYESFFVSNLRSSLQSYVGSIKATQLYEDRIQVSDQMMEMCHKVCRENMKGYLTCWGFQLLEIGYDATIENTNIKQQVEKQRQATEGMLQQASLIRSKTEVLQSEFDKIIHIVNSNADAEAVNITKKAQSDAMYNLQQAHAGVLQSFRDTLKNGGAPLTNSELIAFMEKTALIESPGGPMVYGDFQTATVFAGRGNSKRILNENEL